MKKKSLLFLCVLCLLIVSFASCGVEDDVSKEEKTFSEQVMDQVWLSFESVPLSSGAEYFIKEPEDIYLYQILYGSFTDKNKREFIAQVKMSKPDNRVGEDYTIAVLFDEETLDVLCYKEFLTGSAFFTTLPQLNKNEMVLFLGSTLHQWHTNQYIWLYDLSEGSWQQVPSGLPDWVDANFRFIFSETGYSLVKDGEGKEVRVDWNSRTSQFDIGNTVYPIEVFQ